MSGHLLALVASTRSALTTGTAVSGSVSAPSVLRAAVTECRASASSTSLRSASTISRDLLGRSRGGASGGCRARKVEQRLDRHEVTCRLDAERGDGVAVLDILEDVVPQVNVVLDELAGDILPVDAGISRTGDTLVECLAANGPPGLGDPDGLTLGLNLVVGVEEELAAGSDVVVHGGLEVGVGVHADEVNSIDDGVVGGVDVDGPGVDVADGLALERSTLDSSTGLLDVVDELLGLSTGAGLVLDTGWCHTVEVLATDGDTLDKVGESSAVLGNGGLESSDFVVEVGLTGGGPHAE